MKTILVRIRRVCTVDVLVEAGDFESAKDIIYEGGGHYIDNPPEVGDNMEPETWTEEEVPPIAFFKCKVCGWEETDADETNGIVPVHSDSPFGEWAAMDCICPRCSENKSGDGYLMMIAFGENNRPILL